MSALTAMQSAAVRLIGRKPSAFFGATTGFEVELCDLINEVAADVAKYQDWQALVRFAELTGDNATTEFALPDDYDRMMQQAEINDRDNWFWGFQYVGNLNAFKQAKTLGLAPLPGIWTLYANKIRFTPAPSSGQVATYPYITTQWAQAADTSPKTSFTADTDAFVLPERLLTLGLVWRWRENKRLDWTGDQEAFVKALDEYAAKDGGARAYRKRVRSVPGRMAWPWQLGPSTYLDH